VAGLAEDLKVLGFVRSPKCKRDDVINIPGFAGVDLLITDCASPFPFHEEV
jgi:hypothetical protein